MSALRPISQLLLDLKASLSGERVSIAQIVEALHERGFGVLIFVFAIPIALPFPVPPGINIAFAAPLLVLTAQLAVGRHTIWLPNFITNKTFARPALEKTIDTSVPWLKKIESLVKPRLGFITGGVASNIVGALGVFMAASIYVPLPLTNTVPGMAMCAMAIGLLMRDGLAVAAGAVIGTAWVVMVFTVFFLFGMEGFELIKGFIKGFF